MYLPEPLKTGLDTLSSAATLSWAFLGAVLNTAIDIVSGRQLPHPDMKSVAEAPEPVAIIKGRRPSSASSRSVARRDDVA